MVMLWDDDDELPLLDAAFGGLAHDLILHQITASQDALDESLTNSGESLCQEA